MPTKVEKCEICEARFDIVDFAQLGVDTDICRRCAENPVRARIQRAKRDPEFMFTLIENSLRMRNEEK